MAILATDEPGKVQTRLRAGLGPSHLLLKLALSLPVARGHEEAHD